MVLLVFILSLTVHLYWQQRPTDQLKITALNVGQGDAIYLRTPQGNDILIDGGPDRTLVSELGRVMPIGDRQIELVIATHPDADHIGGLSELAPYWTVNTLIDSGAINDTKVQTAYNTWADSVTEIRQVRAGDRLEIEPDLVIKFLNPTGQITPDVNDQSVVALLEYRNFKALFTGDASTLVEQRLLDERLLGHLDLLKVSHHGSKTGTSEAMLAATTPKVALVSVGKDNSYGHPHSAVIYRLQQVSAQIWRTDLIGRVTCLTNGGQPACRGSM